MALIGSYTGPVRAFFGQKRKEQHPHSPIFVERILLSI